MTELELQLKKLKEIRPVDWEHMPDIDIYMDQLISYMPRQLMNFESGEVLTSAMVNNYIKAGLMPRATEKRYNRVHIALLTAICMVKHVFTAKDMARLVSCFEQDVSVEELYGQIRDTLDRELDQALTDLHPDMSESALRYAVLNLAVGAYARQLAALRLLDLLCEDKEEAEHSK